LELDEGHHVDFKGNLQYVTSFSSAMLEGMLFHSSIASAFPWTSYC
jgi:hypothetical protein